jgi:hypothetical protein
MEIARFSADWHCTGVGGRCTRVGGLLQPSTLGGRDFPLHSEIRLKFQEHCISLMVRQIV